MINVAIFTICLLIHAINNCLPISLLLEKRCIKFIWNLFNSPYAIHKSVVNGSFHNKGSTISENILFCFFSMSYCAIRFMSRQRQS